MQSICLLRFDVASWVSFDISGLIGKHLSQQKVVIVLELSKNLFIMQDNWSSLQMRIKSVVRAFGRLGLIDVRQNHVYNQIYGTYG